MARVLSDADDLDLAQYVRPGDTVVWGQACAEPLTLTERLMEQRARIGPFRCFLGIPAARTVRPEHADHISFVSYCGSGGNRALYRAGALDILPCHYSTLPHLLTRGPLRADVLLLQLAPAGPDGRYSLGLADDYTSAAVETARVVIAEVNDQVPRTYGRTVAESDLDVVVRTSRIPAEMPSRSTSSQAQRVAEHVASLIDDGATLQFGIGALPDAVLAQLGGHRHLGVHSGLLSDTGAQLMEAGVITNERKTLDRGRSVAGLLMGTRRLFRYADGNPAIQLRDTSYTHDPGVLAAQERLVAVNSVIEVDLSGQANAEVAGGDYVGAVGGAVDFLRGAARSRGGLPIVVFSGLLRADPPSDGTAAELSLTAPAAFSLLDPAYCARYGVAPADMRAAMTHVAWKNHANGALNPRAQFRSGATKEQIEKAPKVAGRLGVFDCSGVSDGAAAALIVRAEDALEYTDHPMYVKGLSLAAGPAMGASDPDYDFTTFPEVVASARDAFAQAGVIDPRNEISLAEVHDCFTPTELVLMEDFGFAERGQAWKDVLDGAFELGGRLPVNPDGGLKSFGHPVGASGLRMLYECWLQFRGEAGERQLSDPALALTHNLGGRPGSCVSFVSVVGSHLAQP